MNKCIVFIICAFLLISCVKTEDISNLTLEKNNFLFEDKPFTGIALSSIKSKHLTPPHLNPFLGDSCVFEIESGFCKKITSFKSNYLYAIIRTELKNDSVYSYIENYVNIPGTITQKLQSKSTLVNEKLNGKRLIYFAGSSEIMKEENYVLGKLHGTQTEFYKNGSKKNEYNYADGKKISPCFDYYPKNNIVKNKFTFKNGSLDTTYVFSFNERLKGKIVNHKYIQEFRDGFYVDLTSNGEEIHSTFKNDKLDGELIEFDKNGGKKKLTTYKEGLKEGQQFFYNPKGEITATVNYKNDIIIKN